MTDKVRGHTWANWESEREVTPAPVDVVSPPQRFWPLLEL
jgi:hypothetical protein